MVYLVKVVETYRADTEEEAQKLIDEAKESNDYELVKFISENKVAKQKGEVIDEWVRTTLTKVFTSEKEPERSVKVEYEV